MNKCTIAHLKHISYMLMYICTNVVFIFQKYIYLNMNKLVASFVSFCIFMCSLLLNRNTVYFCLSMMNLYRSQQYHHHCQSNIIMIQIKMAEIIIKYKNKERWKETTMGLLSNVSSPSFREEYITDTTFVSMLLPDKPRNQSFVARTWKDF